MECSCVRMGFSLAVMESQNHSSWKRPLKSPSSTFNLVLTSPPLHHATKFYIYVFRSLTEIRLNVVNIPRLERKAKIPTVSKLTLTHCLSIPFMCSKLCITPMWTCNKSPFGMASTQKLWQLSNCLVLYTVQHKSKKMASGICPSYHDLFLEA